MMRKIVVGYDGSDVAKRALERAADLAGGGALTVVSVVPKVPAGGRVGVALVVDPADVEEHQRELLEARDLLAARGVTPRLIETSGDPADVLVQTAQEESADVIVIGTRGLGGLSRALLGSVSTKVVHEAHCDVFVVR